MSLDAVIFDCDGVLVNSEEIYQRIERQCLAEIGLVYDPHEYAEKYLGVTFAHYAAGLNQDHERQHGQPLPEHFMPRLQQLTADEVDRSLVACDGALAAVAAISLPKAVASSSGAMRLAVKLRKVGLIDFFTPHVYSAEAVKRGKPAPDVYLYAAEGLGVSPQRCIAVEDSVNGVVSAVGAGMKVIGFVGGGHCSSQQKTRLKAAGAVKVIDHMDQLSSALEGVS